MDSQPLFKKIDPQFIFKNLPQEIKKFWDKHMKDDESLMFETDHYSDVLDPFTRFAIYKENKIPLNKIYLCRGQFLYDGKVVAQYLFDGVYYPENEFLKMLKLRVFW